MECLEGRAVPAFSPFLFSGMGAVGSTLADIGGAQGATTPTTPSPFLFGQPQGVSFATPTFSLFQGGFLNSLASGNTGAATTPTTGASPFVPGSFLFGSSPTTFGPYALSSFTPVQTNATTTVTSPTPTPVGESPPFIPGQPPQGISFGPGSLILFRTGNNATTSTGTTGTTTVNTPTVSNPTSGTTGAVTTPSPTPVGESPPFIPGQPPQGISFGPGSLILF